jgi:hypothetical protein
MLLLMLCLDDILCCPNLTVVFSDLKQLKSNMYMMMNLNMSWKIVERVVHGINIRYMMAICLEPTAYALQLISFIFCCCRRHMEAD